MAAVFSQDTGVVIPAMLGHSGTLSPVSSGTGPQPRRLAWFWATAENNQLLAPEAHTPDATGRNESQMCELDV